ncbi:MAG: PRC-barrel domain-containing protein [Paralcaligenes sp.]
MDYQNQDTDGHDGVNNDVSGERGQMSASSLIGASVCNHIGEDLGEVAEIVLDIQSGKVIYAVLSFGGFLGMWKKLIAVPWDALLLDTKQGVVVLQVEMDRLKHAPVFNKNEWPTTVDSFWWQGSRSYSRANH